MECGAGILGDEVEELLPPMVFDIREESFAERLQFLDADRVDGVLDGFAPRFGEFVHVQIFGWHDVGLVCCCC
jgi:hypothetical protein